MGLACLCMPVLRAGKGWVLSARAAFGLSREQGWGRSEVGGQQDHIRGGQGPVAEVWRREGAGAVTEAVLRLGDRVTGPPYHGNASPSSVI